MPVRRKVFRIEQMQPLATSAAALEGCEISPSDQREILAELKALHAQMARRSAVAEAPRDSDGLRQLKSDTDAIQFALSRTRREIAALHVNAFGPQPDRVTRELDAVVESAERATQQILSAAEAIEDAANTLSASLKREQEQALALDIQDNVLRIFEACNFQDLSGQRIAKVLAGLKFVEERVAHMMALWGGIEGLRTEATVDEHERGQILHGPRLDGDPGHASQDEVDALFATG